MLFAWSMLDGMTLFEYFWQIFVFQMYFFQIKMLLYLIIFCFSDILKYLDLPIVGLHWAIWRLKCLTKTYDNRSKYCWQMYIILNDHKYVLLFYITIIFIRFYNVFVLDLLKISSVLNSRLPGPRWRARSHIVLEYNNQIAYIFRIQSNYYIK